MSWVKAVQKWVAEIQVAGVKQYLGYFDDEADGARAYDAAVAAQNFLYPRNFPDRGQSAGQLQGVLCVSLARLRAHRVRWGNRNVTGNNCGQPTIYRGLYRRSNSYQWCVSNTAKFVF